MSCRRQVSASSTKRRCARSTPPPPAASPCDPLRQAARRSISLAGGRRYGVLPSQRLPHGVIPPEGLAPTGVAPSRRIAPRECSLPEGPGKECSRPEGLPHGSDPLSKGSPSARIHTKSDQTTRNLVKARHGS